MRTVAGILAALLTVATAAADEADLLNAATLQALDAAKASLTQAPKVGAAIKRIGVAGIEGDRTNVTRLVKSALTKTKFDVVLTNDADWGPLLDEFARQVKREDIMLKETAHKLRVQGVDAVIYGSVEKAATENGQEGLWPVRRATVRLMLNLASLSEENPGSLLWSEQFTGAASEKEIPVRLIAVAAAVLAGLLLVALIVRRASTPR